ncbi:unnamed protein product [Arctia plantaginis]|uniref:Uncharacterized protein n=1 Tax=Arctia plantaginis TaxID=874455 RepID=A0A8S1AD83_ARCPL|nr:unnamed protein product [Arctia plantaginis]
MRGAHCWTDHRLLVAKLRPCRAKPTSLNLDRLNSTELRKDIQKRLTDTLDAFDAQQGDLILNWQQISSSVLKVATDVIGLKKRVNED